MCNSSNKPTEALGDNVRQSTLAVEVGLRAGEQGMHDAERGPQIDIQDYVVRRAHLPKAH